MTLPIPSNVFVDGELTNEASWYARVFTPINTIYASVSPLVGQGYLGETDGPSAPTTMTTNGVVYVPGSSSLTVTLTSQRRLRVVTKTCVTQNTATPGRYVLTSAYNTGSSVNTATVVRLGNSSTQLLGLTANPSLAPLIDDHSVLLTTGTYTFYPAVSRSSGGTGSDNCNLGYTAVYDVGAV